jgi:DNA primase
MSSRIPDSFIQEVLARNDIVEIVRARLSLIQRGDTHVARCPFHEEKTPSFNVIHSKQFYYCFGCGASGNAIGFLMAFDHLEFREAIAQLAARVGMEIPATVDEAETQSYQILYQALDSAAQYYCTALRQHPVAIQYLKSRGITGAIAKNFDIGYAPPGRQNLQQQLGDAVQLQALMDSGLVTSKKEGMVYDCFHDRIMFPIRNAQGKVIGFGGRTLGDRQPKYLNSPETPLFHKGMELYGLYEARRYTAKLTQLIMVEGYMDVIALHQHGITHAVATLGTAVTARQVQKCLRYVSKLTFCFDGDNAGRRAAWKALLIALPLLREGIHLHFLFLPETQDPDSLVRQIGPATFSQQLSQAPALSEVFFNELKRQSPLDSPAAKAQFGRQAAQHLNTMPHGLFRQLMYEQLAKELEMDIQTLNGLLQPASPHPETGDQPGSFKTKPMSLSASPKERQRLEALGIQYLLKDRSLAAEFGAQLESILAEVEEGHYLLAPVYHLLRDCPTLTVGELLERIEDESQRRWLAELAAREIILSVEYTKEEFLGVLNSILQRHQQQTVQRLVEKAKKSELNLEEKRKLQTLLAKLKKEVRLT